jgi:hypothetical protein
MRCGTIAIEFSLVRVVPPSQELQLRKQEPRAGRGLNMDQRENSVVTCIASCILSWAVNKIDMFRQMYEANSGDQQEINQVGRFGLWHIIFIFGGI